MGGIMIKNNKEGVVFLTFEHYAAYKELTAVHSTRIGGVSKGCFASMNLGFARGDLKEDVHENYRLFSKAIGVDHERLVLSDQWHHNHILEVDASHLGMGIHRDRDFGDIDGLFTTKRHIPLVTFYADCVPIYFYDPVKKQIGMTHAGWRGTSTGIVRDMVEKFQAHGSQVEDILVGIGPAVCQDCYQVDEQVIQAMNFDFDVTMYYRYQSEEDRYYIDLKAINKALLLSVGILDSHIEVTKYCTKCHGDLFFSHRREGNARGTQIGVMMME